MMEITEIYDAQKRVAKIMTPTPLQKNINFSDNYNAQIFFKREDLQRVRSYKIRGAYNKISTLTKDEYKNGIVCASAGNHAQGVAYSCNLLQIHCKIFMPKTTPKQKIKQVELFGKSFVEIILIGDNFDDAFEAANTHSKQTNSVFVHPFDDPKVIEGQATVALEVLQEMPFSIDFIFAPIGGGGLMSGIVSVFKKLSPNTKIIGVEPEGAPSMKEAIKEGLPVLLPNIDSFVDGAAVKKVGERNFEICKNAIDEIIVVPEGKICSTILKLYNEEAIVVEPAGALSVSALDFYQDKIVGKNVVCIISGGNNDIERTEEIKERSLLHDKLKHYFIVQFPQRAGALKEFVNYVLGENDDITYFQFIKKNSRDKGPVVVGLELKDSGDLKKIKSNMKTYGFEYQYLNENVVLKQLLI